MEIREVLYLVFTKLMIVGIFLITPILGVMDSFVLVYKSIRSDSKAIYKLLRCVAAIIDIPLTIVECLTVGGYLVYLVLPISTLIEMSDFGAQLREIDVEATTGIKEKVQKIMNDFDDCSFYTFIRNKEVGVRRVV